MEYAMLGMIFLAGIILIALGLLREKPTMDHSEDMSIPLPKLAWKSFIAWRPLLCLYGETTLDLPRPFSPSSSLFSRLMYRTYLYRRCFMYFTEFQCSEVLSFVVHMGLSTLLSGNFSP